MKKYYLFVLGCQMNYADAERLAAVLENLGYQKTDQENGADLIAVVACSVRQSAVDRIHGKIRLWQKIKQQRTLITILTGCVLPADKEKLQSIFDFIVDINDLPQLAEQLAGDDLKRCLPVLNYLNIQPQYQNDFSAYVPISTGCNNYCSYCVVPYVRGKEKSRPSPEIVNECKKLIEKGYKEIILLGQNVNSYGLDLPDEIKFPELLKTVNDLSGEFWLRFSTSHPKDMSDELIKVMAEGDKICKYLHLPIQSGDNEILQQMNRKYTREHYLQLIEKIRRLIPNVAIGTDVIVGFPGETKRQFKNTVKLFKEAKFDMAYLAQYSPRAGTVAYKLTDDVSKKEKERREYILNKVLSKTALKANKKLAGKILEVLIDEVKIKDERLKTILIGKTRTYKTVRIIIIAGQADKYLGQFIKVKILKARSFGLEGMMVK